MVNIPYMDGMGSEQKYTADNLRIFIIEVSWDTLITKWCPAPINPQSWKQQWVE